MGEIPEHWELKQLKRLARFVGGGTPPKEVPGYWAGDIPWISPKDMKFSIIVDTADRITAAAVDESATQVIPAGSAVLVVRSGILKHSIPVAVTGVRATLNQDLKALLPYEGVNPRYLAYVIRGHQAALLMEWRKEGATVESLELDLIKNTVFPLPPQVDQLAIVRFLDDESLNIDALIARKERLIELLQEKRTALITRAVTRGLDPSVPTKDSGVEWLGQIPAHWEVRRLWHLTPRDRRVMYGIVLPGPSVEDGVAIVKGGDVSSERLRLERLSQTTFEIESRFARSRLRGGDLVYAIRGSIGEVEMVPDELEGANVTQDAARIAYTRASHGKWLLYVLRSHCVFAQLEARALGATIKGINIRDLKRALLPVPPKSEQETIAKCLDAEAARTGQVVREIQRGIDHLLGLRTALISAAVTGKIDVRKAAA